MPWDHTHIVNGYYDQLSDEEKSRAEQRRDIVLPGFQAIRDYSIRILILPDSFLVLQTDYC